MPIITCVEDLRLLAKKRVPKAFYDYADSGSYTESTYRANSDDLAAIKLRQRVAIDVDHRGRGLDRLLGAAPRVPPAPPAAGPRRAPSRPR